AVAADTGNQPDRERPGVPEKIRVARPRTELYQTLLRPRQMVFLLTRGHCETAADLGIARNKRLRAVERLGADFAGVIDPHQAGGMTSLLGRERTLGTIFRGTGSLRSHRARQRPQCTIEAGDEVVSRQRSPRNRALQIVRKRERKRSVSRRFGLSRCQSYDTQKKRASKGRPDDHFKPSPIDLALIRL